MHELETLASCRVLQRMVTHLLLAYSPRKQDV